MLKEYKSDRLITFLIALIELQVFAVEAKRKCVASAAKKYLHPAKKYLRPERGICHLLHYTPSRLDESLLYEDMRNDLFRGAPSNPDKQVTFPVKSPWPEWDNFDVYDVSSPFVMWGDHPYADNRRQLITEMIEQLQNELRARGYKL